jgi:hypothetical protein
MDGLVFEWGLCIDYYITRSFGLGLFARGVFLQWNKLYTNYNAGEFASTPAGNVGSFWNLGIQLNFRAGD